MPPINTAIIRIDGATRQGDFPRSGDIVVARVVERVGEGLFRISLRGKSMTARSELSLNTGESIKARVEAIPGGRRLKILGRRGPSGEPIPLSRTPSHPRTILTEALLRSGLPVPEEAELRRKTALLSRSRGDLHRLSRLFSELTAKGIDPSADFLERLDQLLDVGRRRGGGERPPPRRWRQTPDSESLAADLTEDAETLPDELRLLNAARGVRGRWAFLPFSRVVGEKEWRGTLKVRVEGEPAITLSLKVEHNTWEFVLQGSRPARLTMYARYPEKARGDSLNILAERLSALNIVTDGSILPLEESDGFPSAAGKAFGPVEEQA